MGGADSRDHLASLHAESRKKRKKRQSLPSALNTLSSLSHSSLLRSPCNAGASAKKASTTTPSPPKKPPRYILHTTLKTYVILHVGWAVVSEKKFAASAALSHSLSFLLSVRHHHHNPVLFFSPPPSFNSTHSRCCCGCGCYSTV